VPTVVILLGPPGAGKGTQASRLAGALALPHVSTGDLFRENLAQGTDVGRRAKAYMESGKLVPDDIVLEMLRERVARPDCREGYLLDGFPRTLPQAEALAQIMGRTRPKVRALEVRDEVLVERAAGRLSCRACGRIYHARHAPPKRAGRCDADGGELYTREDDAPEVVRKRLAVYHQQTRPLVEHYAAQGVLRVVDGEQSPAEVYDALLASLREAA
jgi:adenylate kinase